MQFHEYQVGTFYKVPCVRVGSALPACARPNGWIPILLPWHEDAAIIGFPHPHYHYDPRFLGPWEYEGFSFNKILTRHPVITYPELRVADTSLTFFTGSITFRRLKCKRVMPEYPVFAKDWHDRHWPGLLECTYATKQLKHGICPHKGIDLTTCPVIDGVVTCPGHGLRWNVKTGRLVKR